MSELHVLSVQADNIEVTHTRRWATNVVKLGVGQQSNKFQSRPFVDLTLSFKNPYGETSLDELVQFFDARGGRHESFIVPSWVNDGRVTSNYAGNITTLNVSSVVRFTTSPSSISNFVVVGKRTSSSPFTWAMETSRINSIVGSTLYLSTPFSNSYAANSFVYVGYKVKFQEDELPRRIVSGEAYLSESVNFEGVF